MRYRILAMNHIESGFLRENQCEISNGNNALISQAKSGGSIESDSKKISALILADWGKQ